MDIENVPKDGVEFAFMFEQVSSLWENDLVSRVAEAHKSTQKTGLLTFTLGMAMLVGQKNLVCWIFSWNLPGRYIVKFSRE